jgi:hypothetical protein
VEKTLPARRNVSALGLRLRSVDFEIVPGHSPDAYFERLPAEGWKPNTDRSIPIGKRQPFDWDSVFYSERRSGKILPNDIYRNLIAIANHAKASPGDRTACLALCRELADFCRENSVMREGARFISQKYPFDYDGDYLAPGWTSGIDTGFVVRGLCRVQEVMPDADIGRLLDEFARAFTIVDTTKSPAGRPWFSFCDDAGYLWFEEKPHDESHRSHILNGHIHALLALYHYRGHCGEVWVDQFLRAAITTVFKYVRQYRVPGNVNRYDLFAGYKADYAPNRTVRQQRDLAIITTEPFFRRMARIFQSDYEMALVSAAGRTIETRRQARPPFDYSCTDEKVRGAEGRPNGTPTEVPA